MVFGERSFIIFATRTYPSSCRRAQAVTRRFIPETVSIAKRVRISIYARQEAKSFIFFFVLFTEPVLFSVYCSCEVEVIMRSKSGANSEASKYQKGIFISLLTSLINTWIY